MQPLANSSTYNLKINGQAFTGWTEMETSRSIERMSGEFRLQLTKKGEVTQIRTGISPGQACSIEIDGREVLKGYIDAAGGSYDGSGTRIDISGRDVTGDLIDCAASYNGPFEYNNIKLDRLIEQILEPFKIPLTVLADVGAPFKRIAIQPGETAYELIDRVCRYRAVLPISDGVGGMLIIKPGTVRSPGMLVQGQNILTGNSNIDWKDRFSLYVVKGQGEANDESTAEETATGEGRATDPLVDRYRPTVITGENQGFNMTLSQRAAWAAQIARARSISAHYKVQGWYADPQQSELWLPNTIVAVKDPVLSINRDMLIAGVAFKRSDSGTTTDLDLVLPEAFDLPAEKEPDNDVLGDS